jgi:tetratricopeptide (TPR) repeat protein
MFDPADCRKAFDYIKQAIRSYPSSILLSVAYGGAELALNLPGAAADAPRRFRAAIRADPTLEEAYYLLAASPNVPEKREALYRQLIKVNPKASRAYEEIIGDLAVQDARAHAAEILALLHRLHEIVPLDSSNFETDEFAIAQFEEAGLYREAFAILQPIFQFGDSDENPVGVCALLSKTDPQDFRQAPEFQKEVARFMSYCTGLDHASAAGRLQDQQKFPEAAHELELQIAANPKYLGSFSNLAKLYLQLGQKTDALRVLRQLLDGDVSPKAKCATIQSLGDLANYRVPGDPTVDRIDASCEAIYPLVGNPDWMNGALEMSVIHAQSPGRRGVLTITIKNVSSEVLPVIATNDACDYAIEVLDAWGKPPKLTALAQRLLPKSAEERAVCAMMRVAENHLKPGAIMIEELDLNRYFELDSAKLYRVRIARVKGLPSATPSGQPLRRPLSFTLRID